VLVAGPSGSGKSTLLRCLNGLVPHFSGGRLEGVVQVDGHDVVDAGPAVMSRKVGFVFQNPESQAVLDVVDAEIAFGLENAGTPPPLMRERVDRILDRLQLTHLRRRRLDTLSGGERQRLALATALVLEPELIVLDEPTSQLDPKAANEFLELLLQMRGELGLTVVLSEHRLERILPFADRLLVLEAGRVVADGPPERTVARLPEPPPVTALGLALGWRPVPLSVPDATSRAAFLRATAAPARRTRAAAPAVLEMQSLFAAHDDGTVLHDVSLRVEKGELVALVGPNGAGKTTLLRSIVGLNQAEAATLQLDGRRLRGMSVIDRCRHIAYLPQNPDDLLFAETVWDELLQTLQNHGLAVDALSVPPERLLRQLGLANKRDSYPRDLSVGERQRVAFGAVAVTEPRLFLLDEPTRGLDEAAKNELIAQCRWWLGRGAGMLLVTHDVELVARVADRVIVLDAGRVLAEGQPEQVLRAHPGFAPQLLRLAPERGWLTLADALTAIRALPTPETGATG
jgi:energy-coupling factor transport system ATP-binding protein